MSSASTPTRLRQRALVGVYIRVGLGIFGVLLAAPLCVVGVYAQITMGPTDLTNAGAPIVVFLLLVLLVAREFESLSGNALVLQGAVTAKTRLSDDMGESLGVLPKAFRGRSIEVAVDRAMTIGKHGHPSTDNAHLGRQRIWVTWRVYWRAKKGRVTILVCTANGRGIALRSPKTEIKFPRDPDLPDGDTVTPGEK